MKFIFFKILKRVVVFTAPFFISCEDNTYALKEINLDRQDPLGTAKNIRMVYTDSIKIQAILTAPIHIDYTNLDFKYANHVAINKYSEAISKFKSFSFVIYS